MSIIKSNLRNWPTLSDFFDNNWLRDRFETGDWMPAVNVIQNDDNYELELAAPGYKKEDIKIGVENGVMTVSAESSSEKEEKEKNYTRKEFSSSSFSKSFTLPENASEDAINAEYKDGVLKITLEKSKKSIPPKKEISVK